MEFLQKSYGEQEWPSRRDQILSLIRTGSPPYVAIPSIRRLELLARSGRFADAAAVLKETSLSSPEEAAIVRDVIKDLRSLSTEKIEEFAKSILPWLETVSLLYILKNPSSQSIDDVSRICGRYLDAACSQLTTIHYRSYQQIFGEPGRAI